MDTMDTYDYATCRYCSQHATLDEIGLVELVVDDDYSYELYTCAWCVARRQDLCNGCGKLVGYSPAALRLCRSCAYEIDG